MSATFRQCGIMSTCLTKFAGLAAVLAGLIHTVTAAAQDSCSLTDMGTASVAAVRDGRTLLLADGRALRLVAIEAGDGSRTGLQNLVAGRVLRLRKLGADHDRYSRLVALVFAGDAARSVQQAMLEAGLARVSTRAGGRACADVFLRAERSARAARRGLWADPNFAPLQADNLTRLQAERGRFALVEGKVLSVRAVGSTIYVNFGRYWTRDFTVIIRRRLQKFFTAAGVDPQRLQGHRIRVRGWIEQRGGPIIEADAPEQIEFVDRGRTGE